MTAAVQGRPERLAAKWSTMKVGDKEYPTYGGYIMPGPTFRAEWTQLVNTFAACRSGVVQEFVERLLLAVDGVSLPDSGDAPRAEPPKFDGKFHLPRPFGECPTCGGVVFEQHGSGKHARLTGLSPDDFDALRRGLSGGAAPPSIIVTDEEARTVREIVQRQDALNDPYAWHKAIEELLRVRAALGSAPRKDLGAAPELTPAMQRAALVAWKGLYEARPVVGCDEAFRAMWEAAWRAALGSTTR